MAMRDGTGPRGTGPMTGRGMGYCNPRRANRRNYGRCYEQGFGRGYMFTEESVEPVNNKEFLQREKEAMKSRINEIDEILLDIEE